MVVERRNAVRGQECHDDLERRKAAYPNRVDSRVSGRPTSQRPRHAVMPGSSFPYADLDVGFFLL